MMKMGMANWTRKWCHLGLLSIVVIGAFDGWSATSQAQPPAAETAQVEDQTQADIPAVQAAITDLSSDKFQERQTAFEALIESGEVAIAPLTRAAVKDDLETGSRCVEALVRIGADKSLRPAVLEALNRVVAEGNPQTKTLASNQVEELSLTDQERAIRRLESFGEQVFRHGDAPITLLRIKKDQSASQFRFFPKLRSVSLDGPMITDNVIEPLRKMPTLSYMTMKQTSITDDGLRELAKSRSIRSLTFQDREITRSLVDAIYEFPALQTLSLKTPVDVEELRLLTNLPKLTTLSLSDLVVSEHGVELLNDFRRIGALSLTLKTLAEDQIKPLADLELPATLSISGGKDASQQSWIALGKANITSISLFRCNIGDSGLAALAKSQSIRMLTVYGGTFTDEGLKSLHGNEVLNAVSLQDTKVTKKGVEALLSALPNVRRIRFDRDYVGEASRFGNFTPPKRPAVSFTQSTNRTGKSAHVHGKLDAEAIKLLNAEPNLGVVFVMSGDPTDEEIAQLKNASMSGLMLASKQITSEVLKPFENHKSIAEITINSSKVDDQIVDDLIAMPRLTKISLGQARISDEGMQRLCKGLAEHDQIQSLSLSQCSELSNQALREVGRLKGLKQLSLLDDAGITGDAFEYVGRAKDLKSLRLTGTVLGEGDLELIEHLDLDRLHLQRVSLSDEVVAKVAESFPELTQIGLVESGVTDESMKSLAKLRKLKTIYITGTKVTGEGLQYLNALSELKSVYASRSEVNPAAIKQFYQYHPNANLELN